MKLGCQRNAKVIRDCDWETDCESDGSFAALLYIEYCYSHCSALPGRRQPVRLQLHAADPGGLPVRRLAVRERQPGVPGVHLRGPLRPRGDAEERVQTKKCSPAPCRIISQVN